MESIQLAQMLADLSELNTVVSVFFSLALSLIMRDAPSAGGQRHDKG